MRRINLTKIVLLFALVLGFHSPITFAGHEASLRCEEPQDLGLAYFDLRNRSTQVQVTNTDSVDMLTIHVQIFADLNNCEDRNFTDTLTPNETHVYDISNLISANGNPINFAIPDNSHGFVVITADEEEMIGNFRIVDVSGYEYRVNLAMDGCGGLPQVNEFVVARFTDDWGANQSDIVGVGFAMEDSLPDGTLDISVGFIDDPLELFIFDDEETGTSCGDVNFGCDEFPGDDNRDNGFTEFTPDFINQGINDTFPNSRGGQALCDGDFNTDGFIRLGNFLDGNDDDFVGFIGLNDGAGRGGMDRFKALQ